MKQRLVGVIVLGCLAIIFLPIVLDGDGITPAQMNRDIPAIPETPVLPQIDPIRPEILADSEALDRFKKDDSLTLLPESEQIIEDATEEISEAVEIVEVAEIVSTEQPSLNLQGLPESWSIRLGSFAEVANADALVRRLIAADYKAYKRPITSSSQGMLTAVYVGPVITEAEIKQLQNELEGRFGVSGKGIIITFTIEEMAQ